MTAIAWPSQVGDRPFKGCTTANSEAPSGCESATRKVLQSRASRFILISPVFPSLAIGLLTCEWHAGSKRQAAEGSADRQPRIPAYCQGSVRAAGQDDCLNSEDED